MTSPAGQSADSGSFRDRQGRVYRHGGRIIRGLDAAALGNYRLLSESRFYGAALEAGRIVATRELAAADNPLPASVTGAWAGFLEHRRVPVVSYPYEWTFTMLRDAALLQLDLLAEALAEDFTTKDATPYNVQFVERRPVFIDVPSFQPLAPGRPWAGYRQFCELYLFPLMLQAYRGLDFQPYLRASIDGIGLQQAARLLGKGAALRRGVTTHVKLQAWMDRRYGGAGVDVKANLKEAGFNKSLILANVRKMRRLVAGLEWDAAGSEWVDYAEFHNYSEADLDQKAAFVADCVRELQPTSTWDLGCNRGRFAKIAAQAGGQVLALDVDHASLDRLYRDTGMPANVLPLLQNVLDPSPNRGWRNAERPELAARDRPDLVLCLALLHHVVIGGNVPLAEFVDWFAALAPAAVIEFVERDDDKVRALLRNRDDIYSDYDPANFKAQLQRHFTVRRKLTLSSGLRHIYFCSR